MKVLYLFLLSLSTALADSSSGGKYLATSPDEAIDLIQSIFAKTVKMIQSSETEHAAVNRYKSTSRPDVQPHIPSSSEPLDTVKHLEVTSATISTTATIKVSSISSTEIDYHPLPTNERRNGSPEALDETVSLTLVIICSITGMSGLVVAALCWYRLQREVRLAQKIAYTAYRRNQQPTSTMPADTRLAASMEVHHFQSQKKKIVAMEEGVPKPEKQMSTDSEAENGDYTVYECPGLAPTGEMEIHNPLFDTSVLHGTSYTAPK
ncbi:neural proliferation differentiation and control protein 1-like isoform X2 [Protopterus annectens]|uniref:neural proliferation differentiation and control protein 1-like isoform X2 n=1 Tax=Protopterus annectens TaxID=7888 RepID=UPI001CFA919B|nr:neural proliferation differentiation and control protein 1-like isoform X2 [Protopterus annectens]